jgi:hypothetical protein
MYLQNVKSKKLYILKANDKKSRIRIRSLVVFISGSGSVPTKCHGSTTLLILVIIEELAEKCKGKKAYECSC